MVYIYKSENMVIACNNCGHALSRSTKGDLCGACYRSRNSSPLSQASDGLYNNLTEEEIQNLPDLRLNWINEPSQNLTGGHWLKIITQANNALLSKISVLSDLVDELHGGITANKTQCSKNEKTIKQNVQKIDMQVKEISTLKTVILNQQLFIESSQRTLIASQRTLIASQRTLIASQRTLIAKHLMITGIPNDDIKWGDRRYIDEKEKVLAILDAIDVSLDENNYEIIFLQISAQLIFSNFEKKKTVLGHVK